MGPLPKEKVVDRVSDTNMDSEDGDGAFSISSTSEPVDEGADDHAGVEPEYHTEESDEDDDDEESDSDHDPVKITAPLLPAELLKPLPSPVQSLQQPIDIPREQMTRQQKVAQRQRSRKANKRVWDRLKQGTDGTGILEAGRFAQLKRGVALTKDRVQSGRVGKKTVVNAPVSGRQQLLEQRKRAVEQSQSKLLRPQGKRRARRRKPTSVG